VIAPGAIVQVAGHLGSAFRYLGPEMQPDADTHWSGYEVATGRHVVVMVGDDHKWIVDFEDMSPLAEDAYCNECGQIGCGHGSNRDE